MEEAVVEEEVEQLELTLMDVAVKLMQPMQDRPLQMKPTSVEESMQQLTIQERVTSMR